MSLDIRSGFSNRVLFVTGGSGFVGKVLLFKILKEAPDVQRIYLLMRGKKSRRLKKYLNPQERLDMEVLSSPCFDPLRQSLGDAKWQNLCSKISAIPGDIMQDHVGLSEMDRAKLANEVHLIVHLAATVNFNERMNLAIQMNTLGGLRVLALAKTCKHLEAMVHVSTCYVNYRRSGRDEVIEEKLYPLEFDPEDMCKRVLAINDAEVETVAKALLKEYSFPNTYTFTKCIGEQLIHRYKENVPVVVVRPSIVGCSLKEPFPGWVDALTAAGGLLLTVSLGVVREVVCDPAKVADVVPVDFVVNVILKALFQTQHHHQLKQQRLCSAASVSSGAAAVPQITAATVGAPLPLAVKATGAATNVGGESAAIALTGSVTDGKIEVDHQRHEEVVVDGSGDEALPFIYQVCTSSCENNTNWGRVKDALLAYMGNKRHPKSIGTAHTILTPNSLYFRLRYYALRYAPYVMLKAAVQMPSPIGTAEKREIVGKLGRVVNRAWLLNREFQDFTLHEWFFSYRNSRGLDNGLNEYSRKAFAYDPYAINWYSYAQCYAYGIFKYVVRETGSFSLPPPSESATELFERASSL